VEADEFSATEVFLDSVRAWLSQLHAYAGIALVLHAPLLLLTLLPPLPGPVVVALFLLAEMAVALLVKAALVKAVIDAQRDLPTDLSEYVAALRTAPHVMALGARILGRATARIFLGLVPGLRYLAETFAAIPALIVEDGSTGEALKRSQQITRGAVIQVLGICLAIWTLGISLTLLSGVYRVESLGNTTWLLVYVCARSLDRSLAAVLSAITYHHLSQRPEAG
jgi:hypothetical protein